MKLKKVNIVILFCLVLIIMNIFLLVAVNGANKELKQTRDSLDALQKSINVTAQDVDILKQELEQMLSEPVTPPAEPENSDSSAE